MVLCVGIRAPGWVFLHSMLVRPIVGVAMRATAAAILQQHVRFPGLVRRCLLIQQHGICRQCLGLLPWGVCNQMLRGAVPAGFMFCWAAYRDIFLDGILLLLVILGHPSLGMTRVGRGVRDMVAVVVVVVQIKG